MSTARSSQRKRAAGASTTVRPMPAKRKKVASNKTAKDAADTDADAETLNAHFQSLAKTIRQHTATTMPTPSPAPITLSTDDDELHVASTSADDTSTDSSVICLSHLPFGFFESEIKRFLAQFGGIKRMRLSRNPRTGKSRHYAFIEFEYPSTASVVAKSMNGYMMFGRTIKCNVVQTPNERIFDVQTRRKPLPFAADARRKRNAPPSTVKASTKEARIQRLLNKVRPDTLCCLHSLDCPQQAARLTSMLLSFILSCLGPPYTRFTCKSRRFIRLRRLRRGDT